LSLSGGVALLLLILLGLIMRRRKEAEAEFAESILVTPDGEALATASRGSVAVINEPSEETSFMSDFSPSDIDALQDETGEVDPISEADVYIAYGRYQQAEELIKQAIERFPEREELKHKLLEIYYSARNEAKYSSLAEELQQAGLEQQKPDIWAKVVAMGRELNPSNVLFTSATGLTAGLGLSDEDPLDDLGLNLDSGLSGNMFKIPADVAVASPEPADEMDALDLSSLTGGHENDSDNFDVDLSLDSEFLNSLGDFEAEAPGQRKQVDSLDFGAGDLGTTVERSQQAANEDDLALVSSLDGLSELSEFQIEDADRDSFVADDDNIVGIENSESLEDLDLESLEKELELLSGDLRGNDDFQQKKRTDTAHDELDLSDGLETQSSELNLSDELEIPSEELDLNATDEVTTKLDLARAYVDMGDAEGAKSILEEVVTEGSDDQKQQARDLLEALTA
jgi:pilus assembly protein FimV